MEPRTVQHVFACHYKKGGTLKTVSYKSIFSRFTQPHLKL